MTIKLGRYNVEIDEEDIVLDNGCCIQVLTRGFVFGRFVFGLFNKGIPRISKKLFSEFLKKKCLVLFKENEFGKYYHFDLNRLLEEGYAL